MTKRRPVFLVVIVLVIVISIFAIWKLKTIKSLIRVYSITWKIKPFVTTRAEVESWFHKKCGGLSLGNEYCEPGDVIIEVPYDHDKNKVIGSVKIYVSEYRATIMD